MAASERVEFAGADGQKLAARLDRPVYEPKAWALFAHCFSCSKDLKVARIIAERLVDHGYGALRFDFTGLGQSEGDFANTNFSTNVQDLIAAAQWLGETYGGPQLLIGHSFGGAAVIVAAGDLPSVKAVAAIAAPSDADSVLSAFSDNLDQIETQGEADVTLAGRTFTIKRQFLEDVRGASVREAAEKLHHPLLLLHGPLDQVVGIENATRLFVAAKHPKSFISLDHADHLLSRPEDAAYAADMIAAWAERNAAGVVEAPVTKEKHDIREAVVTETRRGRYENSVNVGPHHLLADEPVALGGGGRGLDPYEFLLAGLGACTSMTIRMYANRKSWPLEAVSVRLTHQKGDPDGVKTEGEGRLMDVFDREIRLEGPLDDAQRARLVEIADKCPVHRTLHDPKLVRTRLV